MIPSSTRTAIIADRFAYTTDETVLVNASQLCNEIIAHDRLQVQYKHLQERMDLLLSFLHTDKPTYRYIDLLA